MSFKKFLKDEYRVSAQASIEFVILAAVAMIAVLAVSRPFLTAVGDSGEEAFQRSVESIMGNPTPAEPPPPPEPPEPPCPGCPSPL